MSKVTFVRPLHFLANALALMMSFCPGAASAASVQGVARNIDGDSLYVGNHEVRLFGIDAPEAGQVCYRNSQPWDCGMIAADQLSKLVTGKPVSCASVDTDEYGRTVARCTVGGLDVNRAMVLSGYAVAYRHYSTDYVSAEAEAKAAKRGLWAGTFEMPSQYRHEGKGRRRASTTVARPTPSGSCNIKGNRNRRGQWIYHVPGMPYYEQTRAEQVFCSEAEAQAAGYRRAKVN